MMSFGGRGQTNLVPNPSFEQFTNCPVNFGSISNAKAAKADIWYKPDIKGASYYTLCTNNQPYDGIPYNFLGEG